MMGVVQKTLVPKHVVELQKIDKKLSKLERKVLFMSHEFKALEDEIRRVSHDR
ncbi:hypothetical protein [Thermococcus sp.]